MIHTYRLYCTNIVLDVNSGAVHVFDDTAYSAVNAYSLLREEGFTLDREELSQAVHKKLKDRHEYSEVCEALQEIFLLESEGLLFAESIPVHKNNDNAVKAMCLNISHDCNMRCGYCFASKGDFGTGRLLMDTKTAFESIDFLVRNSGSRSNLEVDFFGGEPLMNTETMFKTVEYARSIEKDYGKRFRFTVTTNGVLLDEKLLARINKEFENLVMSLDGRKETHDRLRRMTDGKGSYDTVVPNIIMAARARGEKDHFVRGTYTAFNLDFSRDVLHMADLGFKSISVEPVVAPPDRAYAISDKMLEKIFNEYEKLSYEYVNRKKQGKGFKFFHFEIDLNQGPCIWKRLKGCGAGYEYIAVTPEGDMYPCHQFVGNEDFVMGSVFSKNRGVLNPEKKRVFEESDITSREECSNCWAKYYCGGGCAANAYHMNGSVDKPYKTGCELEKKRIECAIWVRAQEYEMAQGDIWSNLRC